MITPPVGIGLIGRSLLTLHDFSAEEIRYLLDLAIRVKRQRREGIRVQRFMGRSVALIFEKRSTRTRCAFETAVGEEGGHPVFLSTDDLQLGDKESIEDTARVLGRMFDAIEFRGYKQETVEALAEHSGVPVYNGLTDLYHPTQILADLMTLEEQYGHLKGLTLAYVGDGRNNVARSLMIGCTKMGINFTVIAPKELLPDQETFDRCQVYGAETGAQVVVSDKKDALAGAHAVYTDVWISMGEENQAAVRTALLTPYQVDDEMMSYARPEARFFHCLPAIKGKEVTVSVIEGSHSVVWDQAENRKHTIKALMLATMR